jgi:hypothetical protein
MLAQCDINREARMKILTKRRAIWFCIGLALLLLVVFGLRVFHQPRLPPNVIAVRCAWRELRGVVFETRDPVVIGRITDQLSRGRLVIQLFSKARGKVEITLVSAEGTEQEWILNVADQVFTDGDWGIYSVNPELETILREEVVSPAWR